METRRSLTPESPDDRRQFGLNLSMARQGRGMSQHKLADLMYEAGHTTWNQTTVSRVEQGARKVKLQELIALEQIFSDVNLSDGTTTGKMLREFGERARDQSRQFDQDLLKSALKDLADAQRMLDRVRLQLRVVARDEDAIDEYFADQEDDDGVDR